MGTKMVIVTPCPEPKTLEEIWAHSFEASLQNGEVQITEESQFGWSDEPCWQTKRLDIDTDKLWWRNSFRGEWRGNINAKCILFGFLSFYLTAITVFSFNQLMRDILRSRRGTLHQKSALYRRHLRKMKNQTISR